MALLQGEMRVGVQSLHLLLPQQAPSPAERTPGQSKKGEGGWRRAEAVLPGATLPSIRTKPPSAAHKGRQSSATATCWRCCPATATHHSAVPDTAPHCCAQQDGFTSTPLLGNPGGHPHHTPAPFPPPQQVQGSPFQTHPLPANITHVMDWGNFPP